MVAIHLATHSAPSDSDSSTHERYSFTRHFFFIFWLSFGSKTRVHEAGDTFSMHVCGDDVIYHIKENDVLASKEQIHSRFLGKGDKKEEGTGETGNETESGKL